MATKLTIIDIPFNTLRGNNLETEVSCVLNIVTLHNLLNTI